MNEEDAELWDRLVEMANQVSDGHLTVMKFATNWRVGFLTPHERKDLDLMPMGKTFADAARTALKNPAIGPPEIGAEELWPGSRPRGRK
jgi:hypothetical protein